MMGVKGSYRKLAAANIKRTQQYVRKIEELLNASTARFIELATSVEYDRENGQFYFDDYPEIKREADRVASNLARGMEIAIIRGTTAEWTRGSKDANGIIEYVLSAVGIKSTKDLKSDVIGKYLNNHEGALKAFQRRKIGGLQLSAKVWDLAKLTKIESELARSIAEGTSAAKVASSMKELLKRPNELYRRVRDEFGELHLSRRAAGYHPGNGVYRSSYKNALRLARTEINMAYRSAEWESYQDKDYVVGFEIHRSNTEYDCDVCEQLAGKYPKDFVWSSWHPNCRCYMTPILITDEEMDSRSDAIISGESFDSTRSENYVGDVPENFKRWSLENAGRIEAAMQRDTIPYFVRDNIEYVRESMYPNDSDT